jgi:hypothetical protein
MDRKRKFGKSIDFWGLLGMSDIKSGKLGYLISIIGLMRKLQ